jgi:hypothetical protein
LSSSKPATLAELKPSINTAVNACKAVAAEVVLVVTNALHFFKHIRIKTPFVSH